MHAIVLSGALLIRAHAPDGPGRPSIIDAALIFDTGESSRTSAPGPTDAPTAPQSPSRAAEPAAPPPSSAEHTADAPPAETPLPPAAATAASEPDARLDELAAATDAEPERVAAEPAATAPASDESPAATATAAERDATQSPATETANESAVAAVTPLGAEHSEPIPTREHAMLSKRFASWTGQFEPGEAESRVAWKQNGQAYTAVFRQASAGDPTGVERIVVDVSTEQGGKKLSTQLTMTRLSFSNFAQFVDRWNPEVQIHDDEIDGRFHSNTEINLSSMGRVSPVFHGKVTLAAHDFNTDSSWPFNRRQVFPEGLETGVHKIVLPSRFLGFLNAAANGDANVQRFERDARITFHEDGTYDWSYVRDGGGSGEERRAVTSPAHYLLGLAGATLRIKGTVRGKVLVYAADRIVIDNDVRYAHAHDAPDLDDYLGLVAETAVEIAEPEVTGLGDLKVDASIYARREFAVREFRSRPSGTLRIFGSLTAGSLTATEPRFATRIEFDPRLKNARPPSFPLTDRYELESWNGEWRVEDGADDAATTAAR
jgi:hypothetical protein